MNSIDDHHAAPPTIAPSASHRLRGRPRLTGSRLTRRPHARRESAADHGEPRPGATTLPEWHAMTEPEYVLAWQQLRSWTAWLVGRYRLVLEDRLPPCWPQHPELIEELWALRAWRAEAYGPDGSGQSAVYWHQALVAFLGHVTTWWAGGCRAGHASVDSELSAEHASAWADADPLAGVPRLLRPAATVPTDPKHEPGVITMPQLNVLTIAQMQALTDAGLAHPQHHTITAFTYYDGSWWTHASPTRQATDSRYNSDTDAVWFRADDIDPACDPTFQARSSAALATIT
ncbi:hypothetical protein KGA66_27535 [Actinocrinis puniceicyclus]|uniref:Uncharacterized protein n=1 Tax=Actinocrinis puniceicyclus TaxID=977794 RepID=A0A8J8BEW7_9ACTN|nr:hypothetical protein [Actinocrinis puniceicyclus]MBS2966818.1 hypothetical protein [Actinocrinis puniceicyclus]